MFQFTNSDTQNNLFYLFSLHNEIWHFLVRAIYLTLKRYLLCKAKYLKTTVDAKPRNSRRNLFTGLQILPLSYKHIFSLMKLTAKKHENCRTQQYVVLTREINSIFIYQLPTFYAFRKVQTMLTLKCSPVYCTLVRSMKGLNLNHD
jgi:hypothetical protein